MAARKFTLLDAMVLVAATAVALMAAGPVLRDLTSDVGHVGQVAFNKPVLRGRTAEDILHDPDLSWLFDHSGRAEFVNPGSFPGQLTPWYVLFDPGGPWLIRKIAFKGLLLSPSLGVWGIAILALRFRAPRPTWREMAMQPGVWACVAPLVALLSLPALGRYFALEFPPPLIFPTAVAAAWLILALCGRWRPEPSWVDRAGRGLGVGWLVLLLFGAWTL